MGAPPVPRAGRTDAVLREFVARAAVAGRAHGGFHHRNHVVPLTEPLAGLLGREPGTLVTVRVPRPDAVPVVIRTWAGEPEILRAVRRVLPQVPECLAEGPGYAVHSYVDGAVLADVCGPGEPVDGPLLKDLAELLAAIAQVRGGALPPLPARRPRDHTDSQGFLRTLAHLADEQIRRPNRHRYGGLFTALGVPEDALARFADRVPAMTRRPYGLLHGDLHRGNLVLPAAATAPLHCVDWELAGYGDPLHDLAVHLVRMRYPEHQRREVIDAWAAAVQRVRPAATAGLHRDLRHYLAFEHARSLYADVVRAARSLEESFGRERLERATATVRDALRAAAAPLRLGRVPEPDEIERILFRRGASGSPRRRLIGWRPDPRVPEHPDFPRSAVADALFLEGAAPAGRVFKGAAHLNTVLRVPGTPYPVVVRREAALVLRRETGFLSEHAVLRAIERSGVPVAAPRVLALGESHATDPGLRRRGDRFAVHTYEGAADLGRRPEHPVDGLRPHEADCLVDQLAALTLVDHAPLAPPGPPGGPTGFYHRLSDQLVALVAGLPAESQRLARFLGLPDAPRLREILARHRVTSRDPALLHGDLNPWNLVRRDDGPPLTLIDWEMALVGDPLYDLVRHMHLTPTRPEIRDRMFRRWEARLAPRFTQGWQRDWRVYRWTELVRSAYVDLDRLVTGAALDAPNVRRAVESYAMTLAAATASLGLSSRWYGGPHPGRVPAWPPVPGTRSGPGEGGAA
ncbi:aminoglycoside phosphotransferase family protein [Streptomyces sp. NRRL S-1022]|uniref:aminoglycoside phosphotransferase family protein n=1 Tax=Streptomyces sp. NRRL S-1022 TaxID=1463880 RepID=UPI0007C43B76|nr:aminoglycoside phosphotransferase family protein [Streptomyces sp. NRRL S-1022]